MTTPGLKRATLVARAEDAGERIDRFITARLDDLSRSRAAALLRQGHVRGAAGTIVEPSHRVKPGEAYEVEVPEAEEPRVEPEAIPLNVVYEDDDVIVIDKPAGLVVHPGAGNETGTLVNALLHHCGESLSGIGGVKRPGIVHRLDKDTSGLLVAAKNDAAHRGLARQFADHGRSGPLERAYLAFVWGEPPRSSGVVDLPIARHPSDRTRQFVARKGSGRAARTRYTVIERYPAARTGDTKDSLETAVSMVRCELETGRTHQIRVHMASLGTPVVADDVYGAGFRSKIAKLAPKAAKSAENLKRQALHAAILGFEHPITGENLRFESPLPTDLADFRVKLTSP